MRPTIPLTATLLLIACGGDPPPSDAGPPPGYRSECENLDPSHCMLPWPSSFFLAVDLSRETGLRIEIPLDAVPSNVAGVPADQSAQGRFDGFSPSSAIMTVLPDEVDPALLHGEDEIAATLEPGSSTVLLDTETGERVAHFAELDLWPLTDPARRPLYLRPAARLEEGRRYVVAIRGLATPAGTPIEASPYFAALRDGGALPGTDVEARRARFEEIFDLLDAAGVERGDVQLAWDFVTASGASLWGDAIAIRDDALGTWADGARVDLGRMGAEGLGCAVTRVEEAGTAEGLPEEIWRRVSGTITVPLYLEGATPATEDSRLHRGADGRPEANGTVEVPFLLQIPMAVRDAMAAGGAAAPLEIYGHGQFGSRAEVTYGWHREHQQTLGVVSVGIDWWGMSESDLGRIAATLTEWSQFDATGERLVQGVVNVLALERSMSGVCADLAELAVPLDAGGTALAYDPSDIYYYGNSQGGIFGGAVAGLSNGIERFVLGVGGMSYPLMIKRSVNWVEYESIFVGGYADPLDRDVLLVASETLWGLAEPSTYAPHLVTDPLPGTRPKRVLIQIGVGDAQVPNVSTFMQARTAGIPLLTPSVVEPWGVATTEGPAEAAMVVYAIDGVSPPPAGTRSPGDGNAAHEGVRRTGAAVEQIRRFVADGEVVATCDGPCDPE